MILMYKTNVITIENNLTQEKKIIIRRSTHGSVIIVNRDIKK